MQKSDRQTGGSRSWHPATWPPGLGLLAAVLLLMPWLRADLWLALPGLPEDLGMMDPGYFRTAIVSLTALFIPFAVLLSWWRAFDAPRKISAAVDEPDGRSPGVTGFLPIILLAGFTVWAGVSIFWSADRFISTKRLNELVPFAVLTAGCFLVGRRELSLKWLIRIVSLAGAITGGVAAALYLAGIVPDYAMGRIAFPYEHPAALGGSLIFPSLVSAVMLYRSRKKSDRNGSIFFAACLIACVTGFAMAQTRSNLLGVAAGVWLGALMLVGCRRTKLVFLAAGVIAAAGVSGFAVHKYSRPENLEKIYTGTFGTRVLFVKTALRMAGDKPLTGFGAGTFVKVSPAYEAREDFLHGQRGDVVYTAHSEPAELLAGLGAVGLCLWLGCNLLAIFLAWRKGSAFSFASAAGLAGMLVDSFGSMSLRHHELPFHYAIALGLCMASACPGREEWRIATRWRMDNGRQLAKYILFTAGCGACLYASIVVIPGARSEIMLNKAWVATAKGEHLHAARLATDASVSAARFLSWYRAAEYIGKECEEIGEFDRSLAARRDLLARTPANAVNRTRLVNLLYRLGRWREALGICLEGLELNPSQSALDEELRLMLRGTSMAQLRERLDARADCDGGEYGRADKKFLELMLEWESGNHESVIARLDSDPGIIGGVNIVVAPYHAARWNLRFDRRKEAAALLAASVSKVPADPRVLATAAMIYGSNWAGRDMELAAELIDRALSLGRTVPEVIRSAAPLLLALGQYDRARDITSGAIVENPRHPALWQARIETLLHLGDFMTAAEVAGQALRQWPDNPVFRQLLDAASRNLPEK